MYIANLKTVVQLLMNETSNAFPIEISPFATFPNKRHLCLLELRVTFSCKLFLRLDPLF